MNDCIEDFVNKKTVKKKTTQISYRIEEKLLDRIRKIVEENNLASINEFITDCIEFALENMKDLEDTNQEWIEQEHFRNIMPK